jgi:hypothetical protein
MFGIGPQELIIIGLLHKAMLQKKHLNGFRNGRLAG